MNRIITIAGLCIIGFCVFALTAMGMYSLVTGKSLEPVTIVVGSLSSLMTLIVGYFWGSSQGSKDKTALLNSAAPAVLSVASSDPSLATDAKIDPSNPAVVYRSTPPVGIVTSIILLALFLGSCRTVKQSTSDVATVVVDTSKVVATEVKQTDSLYHSHYVEDTAVGIAGGEVNVILPVDVAGDLDTTVKGGNVTVHSYHDNKGRQHIDCKADSLTLVIKRLQVDSVRQSNQYDSAYSAYQKDLYTRKEVVTAKTVVEYPRWKLVCLLVLGILIGAVVGILVSLVYLKVKRGLTAVA